MSKVQQPIAPKLQSKKTIRDPSRLNDGYDSQENSDEELNEEEYQKKLVEQHEKRDKELKRHHVTLTKLKETTNIDWFFFENRIKKCTLDLLEPVFAQQKKQKDKIAKLLNQMDKNNYSVEGVQGEVVFLRAHFREFDHVKADLSMLEQKNKAIDDKVESRCLDLTSKINTVNDRLKASDIYQRTMNNSINLFSTEVKNILRIVSDSRERTNQVVRKSLDDMDQKYTQILKKTALNEEKMNKSLSLLENNRQVIAGFEKQLQDYRYDQKKWKSETMNELKYDVDQHVKARLRSVEDNIMENNRNLSDVRHNINEIETYIDKYLPYNNMVDVIKMLNYTITDNTFFNSVIDYQGYMKKNFIQELETISTKVFTLNKRKFIDFDIPQKRRVIVQEFIKQNKQKSKIKTMDEVVGDQNQTVIDGKVIQDIKVMRRRRSQRNIRKIKEEFGFIKEIKVRSKDDNRFEAKQALMFFKVPFQKNHDYSNFYDTQPLNSARQDIKQIQESLSTIEQKPHDEKPYFKNVEVFKPQVLSQTIVKSVMDEKVLGEISMIKRNLELLKREVKNNNEHTKKQIQDQHISQRDLVKQFENHFKQEIKLLGNSFREDVTRLKKDIYRELQNLEKTDKKTDKDPKKEKEGTAKPTSATAGNSGPSKEYDEVEIKRLINSNVQRLNQFLQNQVEEMKTQINNSQKQLDSTLANVQTFDRDIKINQVQLRQAFKEIRQQGDKLGEQIFNLEEKSLEQQRLVIEKLEYNKLQFMETLTQQDLKFNDLMTQQLRTLEEKIKDEIEATYPDFNLQIMSQTNELIDELKTNLQQQLLDYVHDNNNKHKQLEQTNIEIEIRIYQEASRREQEDRAIQERMERSIKEVQDLIELRYQRKQKTKVDFLLEIKNMHQQMKIYNDKMKENQGLNELMVELFHYVKILELEVTKANHQMRGQIQWMQATTKEILPKVDPGRRMSIREPQVSPQRVVDNKNEERFRAIVQGYDFVDLRCEQLKTSIRTTMREKSTAFTQNHDVDVEIDYIQDQLSRLSADQIMEIKILNLRAIKDQERKSICKQTTQRLSTLEQLLLNSNSQNEKPLLNTTTAQNVTLQELNPYQLDIQKSIDKPALGSQTQANFNKSKKLATLRDAVPLQVKTHLLGSEGKLPYQSRNASHSQYKLDIYQTDNLSRIQRKHQNTSVDTITLTDRSSDHKTLKNAALYQKTPLDEDKKIKRVVLMFNNGKREQKVI